MAAQIVLQLAFTIPRLQFLTTPVFFKHFWSLFNIYLQIWKYPGLPLNVAIHVPGNLGVVLFHTLFYPALKHTNK